MATISKAELESLLDDAEDVIADALDALEANQVGEAKQILREWLEEEDAEEN